MMKYAAKTSILFPALFLSSFALMALAGCGQANLINNLNVTGSQSSKSLVASTTSVSFGSIMVGQTATASVSLTNSADASIEIDGLSTTGQFFTSQATALPTTVAPGATYSIAVNFAPSTMGTITGQLKIRSKTPGSSVSIDLIGTGTVTDTFTYSDSTLVSTLTPPDSTPLSSNFFGMTIFNLFTPNNAGTLTPFPSFPVSALRLWDVNYWSQLEPSDGVYDWYRMDHVISTAQQDGVNDFIFTFGHVPQWASLKPNDSCNNIGVGTCGPPDMTAFDDFATQLVQRYCGKVKYYETWNEANSVGYWDGNNAQLLAVAQDLYKIAKDPANCGCANGKCSPNGGANPNKVLMPSISRVIESNVQWLDAYLSTAGSQYPYADIAAFHGYDLVSPENVAAQLPYFKKILQKHGLGSLDLWDTEASWGELYTPVTESQASWLMREHVLHAASGVSRFVWYAYDSCQWGSLWVAPVCDAPQNTVGQLNDSGIAYGTIEHWLIGASVTQCQQYQNGLWACELQRPNNYDAWMLWSATGTDIPVSFAADSGLTIYRDWQDNVNTLPSQLQVGQMPVLVEFSDIPQ